MGLEIIQFESRKMEHMYSEKSLLPLTSPLLSLLVYNRDTRRHSVFNELSCKELGF